jgi:FAD/FMN-containing dehydrogenase
MKYPFKVIQKDNELKAIPQNTKEVSTIMKFCNKKKINIIPLGGETNRVEGTKGQSKSLNMFIDFKEMNKIEEIDRENMIVTAQAGTKLKKIQNESSKKGLIFPVNIAPSEKCTIGGNVSTNVGGLQTLKYGNIEDHINGLEVVLSDGTILDFQSKLKKDNFGPKLWKIFCGSEGIFGTITKANLKLLPKKKYKTTYLVKIDNLAKSNKLLKNLRNDHYDDLISFEIIFPIPSYYLFKKKSDYHLIIEFSSNHKINFLNNIKKQKIFDNLKILKIERNFSKSWIWSKREELVYNQSKYNFLQKFDISLPINKWGYFTKEVNKFIQNNKIFTPYFFGHLGDGNLHCNFKVEPNTKKNINLLSKFIYDLTITCDGSIAAEHGLGVLKNKLLIKYKSKNYYEFLKKFKKHLDPNLVLGKNKLFKT